MYGQGSMSNNYNRVVMLKKSLLFLFVCISIIFSVNQSANAQLKYGAGIFYGTWLNNPGLSARAEFGLTDELVMVPNIDLSVPRFHTGTLLNSAGLHLHYKLEVTDEIVVYPLAGATLKSYLDFDRYGNDRVYHNFAINPSAGCGGLLKLSDSFLIFAELRYELGTYLQMVSTVGFLMRPGK